MPVIKDKLGLSVAARSSFTGRFLKVFNDLKNFDAGFNELFAKLLFKPGVSDKIQLNYYGTNDHTLFAGVRLNSTGNTAEDSEVAYGISNASLKWSHQFQRSFFSNLILTNSRFRPQVSSPDSVLTITVSNEIINRKAKLETILDLNDESKLEAGAEVQMNEILPGNYLQNEEFISSLAKERSLESAVYVSYQTALSSKLKIDAGLRYSLFNNLAPATYWLYDNSGILSDKNVVEQKFEEGRGVFNTYGGFEPRFSFLYLFSPNASVKANYSLARQYIQIVANNTTPLPISRWKTSDINIKPQIGQMWSAGYYWEHPAGKAEFSSEVYYRITRNFTDVKLGSDFLLKEFVETELLQGLNKAYGMEFNFLRSWPQTVLNFNYTYSRSFNQFTGPTFDTRVNEGEWYRSNVDRPHTLNASVKIQQSKIHHFAFSFTFASGRPYTAPEGLVRLQGKVFPIYTSRNNQRIPAYHRLDFSWMINNPSRSQRKFKSNWAFNVYNLYSHKNIYSVFFNNRIGSVQAYKLSVFASAIPSLSYNMTIE